MTEEQQAIPFLAASTRFEESPEIEGCIKWLKEKGFSPNQLYYGPNHVKFKVLRPIQSCGNDHDLPVLSIGVWECVRYRFPDGFSACHWAEFRSADGKMMITLRVGYEPRGIQAIMAWEGNIELVS